MGEEGAIPEGVIEDAPSSDDRWLDDDGRDAGKEPTGALRSATWWCVGAGIMLLLPRQFASAGMAFGIAVLLALVDRTIHPPPKKAGAKAAAEKAGANAAPPKKVDAENDEADAERGEAEQPKNTPQPDEDA